MHSIIYSNNRNYVNNKQIKSGKLGSCYFRKEILNYYSKSLKNVTSYILFHARIEESYSFIDC